MVYVTDTMYYQNQNKVITERWMDIVNGNIHHEEEKSGDDIASDVISRLGLKVKA